MIKIKNILKNYGKDNILNNISFNIPSSKISVLSGPSGCGKTTLLRIIAGFEKPDKGKIMIDDIEVSTPNNIIEPHNRNLAMIFQDLALWPHMTVEKHILFTLKAQKAPKNKLKPKVHEVLDNVKLNDYSKKYIYQLSGGEKQRLAIARALATKAKYLLMDEPFSSLDYLLKNELYELVIRLKDEHKIGILYVTHNTEDIIHLSDNVLIIKDGRILESGSLEYLLNNSKSAFVCQLFKKKDT